MAPRWDHERARTCLYTTQGSNARDRGEDWSQGCGVSEWTRACAVVAACTLGCAAWATVLCRVLGNAGLGAGVPVLGGV